MSVALVLNAGSSSLKVALFEVSGGEEKRLGSGAVEQIGQARGRAWLAVEGRERATREGRFADVAAAFEAALAALDLAKLPRPGVVGHRFVHGGPEHRAPARVDPPLRAALERAVHFAPLHLPAELSVLDAATARFPEAPEVVCFDTGFFAGLPEIVQRLPLSTALHAAGVRRYGFHGLSYEYVVGALGGKALGRAVLAHLGNGASMAAVRDGAPIDTTMGLTPSGGLMMGTRAGDLDPGVLVHLMDRLGYGAREVEAAVDRDAGLLGVSERTSDMRALLEAAPSDPHAALAVEMYAYSARKYVGALAAALGGLDALVFTGGIGEHAGEVRARICDGLAHLGVRVDPAKNAADAARIDAGDGCRVHVIATDEERMIARHVAAFA